mmetsp:Transcript_56394/g.104340  ORF Transcript_56394/g.104340 Transcript_56394/m.104340 type:complete len:220 (-) Transcript_56394:1097-1756(-)
MESTACFCGVELQEALPVEVIRVHQPMHAFSELFLGNLAISISIEHLVQISHVEAVRQVNCLQAGHELLVHSCMPELRLRNLSIPISVNGVNEIGDFLDHLHLFRTVCCHFLRFHLLGCLFRPCHNDTYNRIQQTKGRASYVERQDGQDPRTVVQYWPRYHVPLCQQSQVEESQHGTQDISKVLIEIKVLFGTRQIIISCNDLDAKNRHYVEHYQKHER